jgi:hypothetical protein
MMEKTLEHRGPCLLKGGGGDDEDIPTKLLPPPLHDDQDVDAKNKSNEVRIGTITRACANY